MAAEIIGFVSGKGGTGKTTCAVFVGGALAAQGKRTLLIELDSGLRSVDIIAGVSAMAVFDVQDVLSGAVPVDKALVESPEHPGLSVISAPYQGGQIAPGALAGLCASLQTRFDVILLDTAAGIGAPYRAAFETADRLILVLTPDRVALRDGRLIADEAFERGKPIQLLLNRLESGRVLSGKAGIEDLDEAIDLVGAQLIGVVPESPAILLAGGAGKPLSPLSVEHRVFSAVAQRIAGADVPLVVRQ